jgi:CheY-like chemotaxis protein
LRLELETVRAERDRLGAGVRGLDTVDGSWGGTLHDFKNLLTVIAGHAGLLLKRLDEADPRWRNADAIRQAVDSGRALAQRALGGSRQPGSAPEAVDVNAIVIGVLGMLEGLAPAGVTIQPRLARRLGRARAKRAELEQVLVNLAVNALDAMPDGGTLTVETAEIELEAAEVRRFTDPPPGRYIVVAVRDTGRGIEPWAQARLFQPYFTTKQPKGSGLGLATAQLVVSRYGGTITVTSAAGNGSTFQVYLPQAEASLEADPDPNGDGGAAETILVVEEEPELRELVREILELHGYTVLDAPTAGAALALAARHPDPIDLVVSDLEPPGMTVGEFADALRRLRPETLLLCVSGESDEELARRAPTVPAPILRKPFAVGALAAKVREVLDAG